MDIQALNNVSSGLNIASASTPNRARASGEAEASASSLQELPKASTTPPSEAQLNEAVKATNDFVQSVNSNVEFTIDKDTGKNVIKVIDTTTKEVIRQFPSEEMLSIAKALTQIQGLLIQQKA